MNYLSLFSGIEAATVAWHPLGWTPLAFVEIDRFPCAVLAHHYPEIPNLGNVETANFDPYKGADLVVGGSPCQSFSIAGRRLGLDDPRGNLALHFLAVVDSVRPRWVVFENVDGLLSSDNGRDFGIFLGTLGQFGYGFAYRVLNAEHFGVPQRRNRVFVVGYLGDWRPPAAVLFEPHSLSGNPPPRRETGEGVARPLASCPPGGSGYRADADTAENLIAGSLIAGTIEATMGRSRGAGTPVPGLILGGVNDAPEIARALNSCHTAAGRHDISVDTFVAHALRADGFDASEDGTGRGTPLIAVPEIADPISASEGKTYTHEGATFRMHNVVPTMAFDTTQITSKGNYSVPRFGEACHPLAAGAHLPAVAFSGKDYGQDAGEVSPPLRAMGHDKTWENGGGQVSVMAQTRVRRLTPRECERLQGFPDDYTLVPYRGAPAKDGPRYKALGNSMAVPVMRWIGERIQAVDEIVNPNRPWIDATLADDDLLAIPEFLRR